MHRSNSKSENSLEVIKLIEGLQQRFVQNLETMARGLGEPAKFQQAEWFRDEGRHGGGLRFEAPRGAVFNTGSVNASHIHYDDDSSRSLQSATALSTIIHPSNPYAPSIHIHVSFTELKNGHSYWRIMADLNPSITNDGFARRFRSVVEQYGAPHTAEALSDGDKYFFIPALGRHRGVVHFYLEEFSSGTLSDDAGFCERLTTEVIDLYPKFMAEAAATHPSFEDGDREKQLAYHTLYFLQVLTLDRGTTAGLMVHDQNDLGIMGSLPSAVDLHLLTSWLPKHDAMKSELLAALIDALPKSSRVATVGPAEKQTLAATVRSFYKRHPEALQLQASGSKIPRTIANHKY